jgi:hypothetical protein
VTLDVTPFLTRFLNLSLRIDFLQIRRHMLRFQGRLHISPGTRLTTIESQMDPAHSRDSKDAVELARWLKCMGESRSLEISEESRYGLRAVDWGSGGYLRNFFMGTGYFDRPPMVLWRSSECSQFFMTEREAFQNVLYIVPWHFASCRSSARLQSGGFGTH